MLKRIFKEVRLEGKIDLKKGDSLNEISPIIYTGESNSPSSTTYYNSGGKSIILKKNEKINN